MKNKFISVLMVILVVLSFIGRQIKRIILKAMLNKKRISRTKAIIHKIGEQVKLSLKLLKFLMMMETILFLM
ncbi:hypothetical protein [Clostridium botulinum]|uniref:hypothetical protein n=1 Tax=Clostridium botulinum TaxID=1491 RepID=UPI00077449F4|nr:hypothetical protein [Clostridium botulinum]